MEDPRAWEIAKKFMGKGICGIDENNLKDENDAGAQSVKYTPLRGPVSFQGGVSMADVQRLVDELNALE